MTDSSVEEIADTSAVVTVSSPERSAQVVESSPATQATAQRTPASQPPRAETIQSSAQQTVLSTCEHVQSDGPDGPAQALPAMYDLAANDTPVATPVESS